MELGFVQLLAGVEISAQLPRGWGGSHAECDVCCEGTCMYGKWVGVATPICAGRNYPHHSEEAGGGGGGGGMDQGFL